MLLDWEVCAPLIEESVFEHLVSTGESPLDVTKFERYGFVDVAVVAVVMDARLVMRQAVLQRAEDPERFVLDIDQIERFEGRQLVARDDRRHWIPHEADTIDGERVLVLADGQDSIRDGKVPARQDQVHSWMSERPGDIDAYDPRVSGR